MTTKRPSRARWLIRRALYLGVVGLALAYAIFELVTTGSVGPSLFAGGAILGLGLAYLRW